MKTSTMNKVPTSDIMLARASAHVYRLFKKQIPSDLHYHSYEHTVETARAADKLGRMEKLDDESLMLVLLAAWFHDAGYIDGREGHEERSTRMARAFLEKESLTEERIRIVERLILSTHSNHEPTDVLERVLHDADVVHIGKRRKFFRYSALLRLEWEKQEKREFSEQEWAETQLEFLTRTEFQTAAARKAYGAGRRDNVTAVQEKLAETLREPGSISLADLDKKEPSRGIETMFKVAYRNHINLSQIADNKANIMISINAILMSIIVSLVSTRLQEEPWLLIPAAVMLLTSLIAIVFAILSARPKVTSKHYTLEEVRSNRANILFFGNFVNMTLDDFAAGMHEIMGDWDRLYDTMITDLYALGEVLERKYRLLWFSYSVFMFGLIVTVVVFFVLYLQVGLY